jgi:hypothetical protein
MQTKDNKLKTVCASSAMSKETPSLRGTHHELYRETVYRPADCSEGNESRKSLERGTHMNV